jgi:hypothetical protein
MKLLERRVYEINLELLLAVNVLQLRAGGVSEASHFKYKKKLD